MAPSKVSVIAFPAQTSIRPLSISTEQNCRYAEISPLVHQLQAMQKGVCPNPITQRGRPTALTFVQSDPEQSQPVITSTQIGRPRC